MCTLAQSVLLPTYKGLIGEQKHSAASKWLQIKAGREPLNIPGGVATLCSQYPVHCLPPFQPHISDSPLSELVLQQNLCINIGHLHSSTTILPHASVMLFCYGCYRETGDSQHYIAHSAGGCTLSSCSVHRCSSSRVTNSSMGSLWTSFVTCSKRSFLQCTLRINGAAVRSLTVPPVLNESNLACSVNRGGAVSGHGSEHTVVDYEPTWQPGEARNPLGYIEGTMAPTCFGQGCPQISGADHAASAGEDPC